ncbi:MAG: hydrogenase nickel incorporation protein HypA [Verrucomicrobiota bacterium]
MSVDPGPCFLIMIELTLPAVITAFVVLGLLFFFALWFFYDQRDRAYYDAQRHLRSFHCVRCGALYSSRTTAEKVSCPDCGFENPSLRF